MHDENSEFRRQVALAFMAHPDDAEFMCAGTLLRLTELGWDVHIATLTAGDCGSTTARPSEIAPRRVAEATRAADLCGATYHCLWEPDGRVVYDRQSIQKSIDLFREIAPTLVITMPLSDYHVDHEVTGRLGRAASFVYAAPNASCRSLIPGSTIPNLYYCDCHDGVDHLGRPVAPTTVVDVSEQLERKGEMLACHVSQREWLREHNGIDEYLNAMRRFTRFRGEEFGVQAAEGFVQHRGRAFPTTDLLAELFPMNQSAETEEPSFPTSLS